MTNQSASLNRVLTASLCAGAMILATVVAGCGGSSSSSYKPHHFSFSINGGLWVANGTNVLEYTSPFTSHTPNITPSVSVTVTSTGFISAQGVVFDSSGDLWVIDGGNLATTSTGGVGPALDEFTAAQLAAGGSLSLTPSVVITDTTSSPPLGFPQQAIFDSTGNMWVTDNSAGDVNVFSAAQLLSSGDKQPFATLVAATDTFSGPLGLVFDSSGDLWVANNGTTTIFEFDRTTVETVLGGGPNTAVPDIVLSTSNSSIEGPWALFFDAGGDLWSSNANAPNTIVEFSAADLDATGSPAPAVTLSPINVGKHKVPSLNSPNGIAFDGLGNLAVANSIAPFSISIYEPSQLISGGAIKPEILISGSNTGLTAPAGDNFGPAIP
jgi:hypothetical protein